MFERVIHKVLAPVDLTDRETPDMSYAIGLAAQLGAELLLFAVIDRSAMVSLIGRHREGGESSAAVAELDAVPSKRAPQGFRAGLVEDAERILQGIVDTAAEQGVSALGHATMGEAVVDLILKEALVQQADLILVRSPKRFGLMKHLLGSTAGEILEAAPCPVLVAPA